MTELQRKTLCIKMENVIEIRNSLVDGFFAWLRKAGVKFGVVVYSSRSKTQDGIDEMREWMIQHWARYAIEEGYLGSANLTVLNGLELRLRKDAHTETVSLQFSDSKPPAWLTIDDRAACFNGDWSDPMWSPESLEKFKPWTAELTIEDMEARVEYLRVAHYRAVQRLVLARNANLLEKKLEVGSSESSSVSMHETPGTDGNMEPVKGTLWQSESGQKYYVVTLGNRCKEPGWPCSAYPRSVVFVEAGADGKPVDQEPYVVPVSDWRSRMTPI